MYEKIATEAECSAAAEKILGALGLARRAGKLETGGEVCEEKIRSGGTVLAVLACDVSENSEKKLHAAMRAKEVPYIVLPTDKKQLGARLGKSSFCVACAICDEGFAKIVYKALGKEPKKNCEM